MNRPKPHARNRAARAVPLFVHLTHLPVLIIGGGPVAERKARALAEAGASIRLVSPRITRGLSALVRGGKIVRIARRFEAGDLGGAALIYVCTPDRSISRLVGLWARREGRLVNLADIPESSSFFVPSTVVRGDLTIAVSTGGKSPALARKIRMELERRFGPEYADLLRILGEVRRHLLKRRGTVGNRTVIFRRLVDSDLPSLLREGRRREAAHLVRRIAGLTRFRMPSLV